jgi:hypothetical protein
VRVEFASPAFAPKAIAPVYDAMVLNRISQAAPAQILHRQQRNVEAREHVRTIALQYAALPQYAQVQVFP